MANFYRDNDDLRFYVERWIPWAEIHAASQRTQGKEAVPLDEATTLWRELIEAIGEFIGNEVAPHVPAIDREGVRFEAGEVILPAALQRINKAMNDLELHKLNTPRELGGLEAPFLVYLVATEMFARADPALMTNFAFFGGIAMALLSFSMREGTTRFSPETGALLETRWQRYIEEIVSGRAWGSMDITEPDCGSDMGAMRTRAVKGPDGVWRLTGQKIFITSGHGKYHIVIARTGRDPSLATSKKAGDTSGLDELGLFVVPAYEDGPAGRVRKAKLLRAEEKLGHHASATMVVEFDETPGELIGQPGEGFQLMLYMMNGARVGVGFEGVGVLESINRVAHAYAAERRSMGKTIDHHEMIADYLDEMQTDLIGVRALAMQCAVYEELAQKLELSLKIRPDAGDALSRTREFKRNRARARELTPLLKYLTAEQAVLHARRCLQIHGGAGYTTEYAAEKLYRDAVVLPIYEGTSQIQALMAMKDQLAHALKSPSDFMRREAQTRWRAGTARDPLERATLKLHVAGQSAIRHLLLKTATAKLRDLRALPFSGWRSALTSGWDPKRDFAWALLHAERLTRILADAAVADALLAQVRAFPDRPERREALAAYVERAEPRSRFLLDEITTTGARLLEKLAPPEREAAS